FLGKDIRRKAHPGCEFVDSVGDKHRTGAFRSLKVLELPRDAGNARIEDIPGRSTRLPEHFRGLFRITASFITEPPALRIDLKTALDHGPRYQVIGGRRAGTVPLMGAWTCKLGVEPFSPRNGVAAIAGMSEIQCVRHLRYEAAYQLGVAAVTVAGEDQSVAADALAASIAPHNLKAANPTVFFRE